MFKHIPFQKFVAVLLLCTLALGFVSGDDDEEKEIITRDALSFTIPNPVGDTPIFETNNQNGRYIGMHIPLLFDQELHFRGGLRDTKFKQTVLSGLWRMNYDRVVLADGQRHGPMQFSVLGFSLYDNAEQPYA